MKWFTSLADQFRRPRRLALLIDGDNFPPAYGQSILTAITKLGTVSVRRVYGNQTAISAASWHKAAPALGLRPIHCQKLATGKNGADIAMTIDAMNLLTHRRQPLDAICLATSDADLTYLAVEIRERGLEVYGLGRSTTPVSFRNACTAFVVMDDIVGKVTQNQSAPSAPISKEPERARKALQYVFQNMECGSTPIPLSVFGAELRKQVPEFRTNHYGFKKLSQLLSALGMQQDGYVVSGTRVITRRQTSL